MDDTVARARYAARLASILIHPAVVMAVAATIAAGAAREESELAWQAPAVAVAAAAVVMFYSAWQARSGRWSHIDASQVHERSRLNRFAFCLLLALAAVLAATGAHPGIVIAIALSGLIVLMAQLLRGRLKSSLHVAFASFAACLVWPHPWAFAAMLLATCVVAWSRLVLRRHDVSELIVGAVIGLACGGLNNLFVVAFASA